MSETNFETVKKAYFIGIGGIGMSAIARMFLLEGKQVFGSDLSASQVTDELVKLGAEIRIGDVPMRDQRPPLPEEIDLVIYTVAIPATQSELVESRDKKIPLLTYPEALGILSSQKYTIAVAGTHGKTTTTAMIAKILIDAGLDPTVIVGSFLKDQKSNFVAGKSQYLVVEACEYKCSFLNIKPTIAVVTNIDDDHLDYYGDLAGVQKGFAEFLGVVKKDGAVVTDVKNEKINPVLMGLERNDLLVYDYASSDEKLHMKIPGAHNIANAKAALAVAGILGVAQETAVKAVESFLGTWRRFESHGENHKGTLLYDDYGHHPTEIKATLKAAKEKFPERRLVVAFQPHLYSRTKEHMEEFAAALSPADEILLLPIYAAREPKDPAVSSEVVAQNIKKAGLHAESFPNFAAAAEHLRATLTSGDVFFTMGAGDINALIPLLK